MTTQTDLIGAGWNFPPRLNARGGLATVTGEEEIVQAMSIILNTPRGQRLLRPEFGCRIHELLFAPINASTIAAACHYVEEALGWWEPRIAVLGVRATRAEYDGGLLVTIHYRILATHDERSLVYPFYTIPGEE